MSGPPRAPRQGYRWVRGLYVEVRAVADGRVERLVPDCCTRCFGYLHAPEDCDRPEWFEVARAIVD